MRRFIPLSLIAGAVALSLAFAGPPDAKSADSDSTAAQAARAFEKMKSLAGVWEASMNDEGQIVRETFELIADDTVVMHTTEFVGNPKMTMVTMYHLDGDDLILKHYCVARNQPEMKATTIADDLSSITFTYTGGTNMKSRDEGHMDRAVFNFIDEQHFSDEWAWYQDGAFGESHGLTYERVQN